MNRTEFWAAGKVGDHSAVNILRDGTKLASVEMMSERDGLNLFANESGASLSVRSYRFY